MPWVPPPERKPLSPPANELANKIGSLIRDYRGYYPDLSDRDVSDALRAADPRAPDAAGDRSRRLVPMLLGVALAVGVVVAVRAGQGDDGSGMIPSVIIGLGVVAGLVGYVLKRR